MTRQRPSASDEIDTPGEAIVEGLPENRGLALLPREMTSVPASSDELFTPPSSAARGLVMAVGSQSVRTAPSGSIEPTDAQLVAGIRAGNRTLGRYLYRRLIRVVSSTLTRVLGRSERDHDDLIQTVFEEIVRSIHSGRFESRCSLTSWAATIACHVGLNAIRSRRMERTVFDGEQRIDASFTNAPLDPPLEAALAAREELRCLRLTLAQMPAGRSEAVLMHDVLGYSLGEIAQINGSTVAAVQSRLVRGRKELAERLKLQSHAKETQ